MPDAHYFYQPEAGFLATAPHAATLRLQGRTLLALGGRCAFEEPALREAKRFMRVLLQRQLGDRPLQSRALFGSSDE